PAARAPPVPGQGSPIAARWSSPQPLLRVPSQRATNSGTVVPRLTETPKAVGHDRPVSSASVAGDAGPTTAGAGSGPAVPVPKGAASTHLPAVASSPGAPAVHPVPVSRASHVPAGTSR